jgi:hypothetical protein
MPEPEFLFRDRAGLTPHFTTKNTFHHEEHEGHEGEKGLFRVL